VQQDPPGSGAAKQTDVRDPCIRGGDGLDQHQFNAWVKHDSNLPGERV
jgi:hypothetical protein